MEPQRWRPLSPGMLYRRIEADGEGGGRGQLAGDRYTETIIGVADAGIRHDPARGGEQVDGGFVIQLQPVTHRLLHRGQ